MQINLEHDMFLKCDTGSALRKYKVPKLTMNREENKPCSTFWTFLVV